MRTDVLGEYQVPPLLAALIDCTVLLSACVYCFHCLKFGKVAGAILARPGTHGDLVLLKTDVNFFVVQVEFSVPNVIWLSPIGKR